MVLSALLLPALRLLPALQAALPHLLRYSVFERYRISNKLPFVLFARGGRHPGGAPPSLVEDGGTHVQGGPCTGDGQMPGWTRRDYTRAACTQPAVQGSIAELRCCSP